uniref:Chromosome 19 open reading frame 47 n=1 Tax=Cyanoderma ruficeps TaxID=181631 RepID=A0A8C3R747_9PASS
MLLDLTKELMKELGITVVGDVIAILRHAKVVHRQEMCRAASESLQPEAPAEPAPRRDHRDHRDPPGAAGRMITNSLSRDPAPRAPRNPPGAGISVTVANGAGPAVPAVPAKRRRVTAEMEGKYVVSLPKGTTARSRKILQLQAARGLARTSVFERLGAEAKAAAAAAGKPSGVFSRLRDALDGPGADPGADPGDPGEDPEALPYAGVLKKRRECSGSPGEAQDGAVSSSVSPWGCGKVSSSCGPSSVFRRLGRKPD